MSESYSLLRQLVFGVYVVGLGLSLVEALVMIFVVKRSYDWRAALATIGVAMGRSLGNLVPLTIAMPGAIWLYQHRLFQPERLGPWAYVVLFFGVEFVYYWYHRFSHRVRYFWVSHYAHHTANEINLSASYRVGITTRLTSVYVVFLPMVVVGFEPTTVYAAYALNLTYQIWIHAEWIPKLGVVEGILNTPSAHRVHHGANLEYLDANYGGVTLLFDRLFGTYQPELDDVKIRYGLVKPLHSYNPIKIALYPIVPLLKDLYSAKSIAEFVGYLFKAPGWRPDGNGATTEDLRRQAKMDAREGAVVGKTAIEAN